MRPSASETKHRIVFAVGTASILCAGILTMRVLGPYLSASSLGYEFQLHRYLTDVADGRIKIRASENFIVVGDSAASRALPLSEQTTGSALSFAVHGGTTLDSYFLLRRYLERHKAPPCIVLMTRYGDTASLYPHKFWSNFVGQNFYRPKELEELYSISANLGTFPARDFFYPEYRLQIASVTLFNLFSWQALSNLVFRPYSAKEARQRYRLARESRGSMPWRRSVGQLPVITTEHHDHLLHDFIIDPLADYAISQLANIKGVNLLIINPPISDRIRNARSDEWFTQFNRHMKALAAQHANIRLSMQDPWLKDIFFQDATHLGQNGDKEFLQSQLPAINACVARPSLPSSMANPVPE